VLLAKQFYAPVSSLISAKGCGLTQTEIKWEMPTHVSYSHWQELCFQSIVRNSLFSVRSFATSQNTGFLTGAQPGM
jgi:hypothetical protein